MDELPNEILVMLLRELNLIELVDCRLISKRFRSLVDSHFRFGELVAFDNEGYDDLHHFNSTIEPFDCEHHFRPSHPDFLESSYFELLFSDLRCLTVDCELANLQSLNKFANLERLQLRRLTVAGQQTLSLKKLKNLIILNLVRSGRHACLCVDSDSVERLYCDGLNSVRFVRPGCLRHLLIEDYSEELLLFTNLETLKINGTYSLSELKPDILACLTSLNEIHLKCDGLLLDLVPLRHFVDQIVLAGKAKIFLYGIQIVRPFDEYGFGEVLNHFDVLRKQFDNYEALADRLDYYTKIDWCQLLECCQNRMADRRPPNDLMHKFSNIRILSAGHVFDPDQFVAFINSCRNLIDLELSVTGLEQSFFERLSLNIYTLNFLILKGENDLSYEFCGRFLHLWKIQIYQNLDLELVFGLIKRLRYLKHFSFQLNGEQLITGRTSKSLYYLERFLSCSMVERNGLSLDQLIELCNSIGNENKVTI